VAENFARAVTKFYSVHREDPESVVWHGSEMPRACLYHERLNYWVEELDPDAPEPLRLAAHCQHLCRWAIPRTDYPEGLAGYRRWRRALAEFHVKEASTILRNVGYDDSTVDRVRDFLTKKNLKRDPEVQRFEDAICLVFFEIELTEFAGKHDRDRLIRILRKVWLKMSGDGQQVAVRLTKQLPDQVQGLFDEAIVQAGLTR